MRVERKIWQGTIGTSSFGAGQMIFCSRLSAFTEIFFKWRRALASVPVNVVETEESLWVIAALPGVSAERMEARIDGMELVISGKRPLPKCCEDGELKIWEIPLGRFERRIRLGRAEKPVAVGKTTLQDGLLIIEIRKQS